MPAGTGTGTTTLAAARRALGGFLRERREAGVPSAAQRVPRRRARGLRREEVAAAAGISTTWYTWLEQGRAVRVSEATVRAIARALGLSGTAREHLLRLAKAAAPLEPPPPLTRQASATLRAVVDAFSPHPAYAVNGWWDVLHQNAAAARLLGDFASHPGRTDNVLRRMFLDPAWRTRFEGWDALAADVVAQFRAATAGSVADPAFSAFVEGLMAESPEFAGLWAARRLAPSPSREKLVRPPRGRPRRMRYVSLEPDSEGADVRVIVYLPAAGRTFR